MIEELALKTIEELAPLLQKKQVSPVEITKSVLQRIEAHNSKLNAFINVTADTALESAKLAELEILRGDYRGALHGIPMALKDNLYIKGEVTTLGSKIHSDFIPEFDATVVSKLKESGVIFTGKLNLHEYAWGGTTNNQHYGVCRNPWNIERIPGGSSGGSGAAVAADMTIASLGTDTGGSIRLPSSACGIIGLKPTYGRVSTYGSFPLAWSLDHIGPMTKTVRDAAILLEAIAGYDRKDPASANIPAEKYSDFLSEDIKGVVIGINEEYFMNDVDSEIEMAVRDGINKLIELGAEVKTISIPELKNLSITQMNTILPEASAIHDVNLKLRPQDFGEDVRLLLELGQLPSAVDYLKAQQLRQRLINDFTNAFESIDVLITPTMPFIPPKIGNEFQDLNGREVNFLQHVIRFLAPMNLTGLPALTIPCGLSRGMPVGMQIIGKAFDEKTVLKLAYSFEKANIFQDNKPLIDKERTLSK
ncbi:aspartyl/glutamyl-tRNA amidotransferase subunit A [Siminovitchia acidinfaciens]|uniref:Aspartyl/glutamyl-tRNA amidotransferase subunit A n=1 Tax=Siminovitchia acidinfaciens TaxID=2321395 RepID=A0A429Y586_9BACI|nr:amidase [Siminovitchia acidinfaciens]RST76479.1 aspartyl/glutamyl-tRNA amidotransferase subunit A [Siminovitchia acidinfaciens]